MLVVALWTLIWTKMPRHLQVSGTHALHRASSIERELIRENTMFFDARSKTEPDVLDDRPALSQQLWSFYSHKTHTAALRWLEFDALRVAALLVRGGVLWATALLLARPRRRLGGGSGAAVAAAAARVATSVFLWIMTCPLRVFSLLLNLF